MDIHKPIPHTYRFYHALPKPKMSPINSPNLTQNYHSRYIERSSGKTRMSNQWCHLMFVKWKYTALDKIGVKVDWFLKIVWKISNLDKSIRLIYKIRNFLTSGLEIYIIWVKCIVNKSQITDVKWVHKSSCNPNKVREMVTHLGTQLVKRITPMYAPCYQYVLETITDFV